jgi:hypothetical protein
VRVRALCKYQAAVRGHILPRLLAVQQRKLPDPYRNGKGEKTMTDEEDYEAEEDAEEKAARWWDDVRARSVGSMHIPEWTYIWAGVMLRRYAAEHPGPSLRHRTYRNWVTLINRQRTSFDPDEQHEYQDQI